MVYGARMRTPTGASDAGFRHEALLYTGADDFAARALPIIGRAVEAGEPVLVAVDAEKMDLLRDRLGGAARSVAWKDIRGIGANPARIIPVWRQFIRGHRSGGRLWGFGEPIWAGRSPAELVEAQRHERLLNLAFADAPPFTLICPYDTDGLDPEVIREAHRSHPFVDGGAGHGSNGGCPGLQAIWAPAGDPLPEPRGEPSHLVLDSVGGAALRRFLVDRAGGACLGTERTDDLTVAIAAVARSMAGPEGRSRLRLWQEPDAVLAEISGLGAVTDPLAGREWPAPSHGPARGLWLANQLCDLVQLRSSETGAVVRLRVRR
jgi:hypothetical protein